ncbi:pyruvate dehydrogenase (acetyl-transferring) E1 component subunit alpha [Sporosalibacterium faouarense]|uniref:pyruvate dehydrogenase (acetyl-transferring) E1 component subunit alpha n=1 Tax=Sporosalibacterium faouarense TaxID=516123 RepID=UPI00141C14EE|nr:pyruvate dehydrogenase (acetyl-transferring) E1 component subunit alpha [Sporosalibacterium faouarense]MTI46904.1 pyruvate dehydrogenase (acetyl-transferring) E1 component subunit alpha [Bacillota bacterium]MTI49888.1 pyruvate dehydrogenase (acetyl-transferring) E1 component subunit alpha [Bacillota bacterium]
MLVDQFNPLEGKMLSILDKDGNVKDKKLVPKIEDEKLIEIYKTMLLTRVADIKALQYQRQGRMLTYAPNQGQEATQVGSIAASEEKDWLVPAFRELGAWLYKGVPLEQIFLYWYGNESGSDFPENVKMLPISVPIASQLNHAVGIGMATNIKGEDEVTLAYVGDGGTSQGEFSEALNFAGVFNTPTVFIISNNQFAISVPRKFQTKAKTLAQKSIGFGIPGIQVDGNDVLAVYAATKEAVDRARKGEGPTLIETVTYRLGPHTTSDDPKIYREDVEVEEWKEKDPLIRFRKYLIDKNLWDEEKDEKQKEEFENIVNSNFKKVEESGKISLEKIFKYNYEEMTPELIEQYEEYKNYIEKGVK